MSPGAAASALSVTVSASPAAASVFVIVFMVMAVSSAALSVFVTVLMIMSVLVVSAQTVVMVEFYVEKDSVEDVVHLVVELRRVDVEHGAHKVEIHFFGGFESAVDFHSVVHVGKVERDSVSVFDVQSALDVPEKRSRFLRDPFSYFDEGFGHARLGARVESRDGAGESHGGASRFFQRGFFVIYGTFAHFILASTRFRFSPVFTETGITGIFGNSPLSQ
jgi:hypothetical protein